MPPKTLRQLRQFHLWFGMLIAPAVLFFAFSGMLQTFDFHETQGGVAPPKWIAVIAQLHKKQAMPRPRPPRAEGEAPKAPKDGAARPAPPKSPLPLKVFVGIMSIGLMLSTFLGIAIAMSLRASRRTSILMLVLGTVLPIALLLA